MAYEKKHGDGVLFKARNKKTDKHPDYTGDIHLDGLDYWLSAWVKTSKAGEQYLSVSLGQEKKPRGNQGGSDKPY